MSRRVNCSLSFLGLRHVNYSCRYYFAPRVCVSSGIGRPLCWPKREVIFRDPPISSLLAPLGMECHRGVYYIIFAFVLFRLLKLTADSTLKYAAITLMLFMSSANALTNYIIFRARNLRLSFIIGLLFPAMDVALFVCLIQLNGIVTWALVPYLLYRVYAVWWGFALWKLNKTRQHGNRVEIWTLRHDIHELIR